MLRPIELIAEPHGLSEMKDEWQQAAKEVYALLQDLNQGKAAWDWPQRFYELGVGNFGERWHFTRRLGACGADLLIDSTVSILSKNYYMDGRDKQIKKSLQLDIGREDYNEGGEIAEIFQILAKIAFTFDWDYAAARCVEEAIAQGKVITIEKTKDWPGHPLDSRKVAAEK
jgi:hypothetical protein